MTAAGEQPLRVAQGGRELFGILHTPERQPARAGILVVNSRVEYRVGPHRFYVRAARTFAERGFAVLRLDHPGNGDSPGDAEYPHMDSFPVEPAVAAVDALRERSGGSEVALAGLCMGARNALYAAARAEGVRHLLAFGMPFSDATPDLGVDAERESRTVGAAVARGRLAGYLRRALDPRAWGRLVTGRSDWAVIRRILPAALGIGRGRIFEEPVFRSLETLLRRDAHVLFLFGSNDVFLPDFRDQFELVRPRLPGAGVGCSVELIRDANHTLSRVEWQRQAITAALAWLERCFPEPRRPA